MPRKARRASNRGSGRYGEGQRLVDASFHLADEIRYIQRRAADHDGRVVTIGQLVLFSSETGDAWLIDRDDRLALRVPDLSSAGLTFKSVQRLSFRNKPLVQIVYLPRSGPPIALCVMKDARPDEAVASRTVDSMGVTTWRQNELTYALIGQAGDVDLAALGKRISNLDTAALFSQAQESVPPSNG